MTTNYTLAICNAMGIYAKPFQEEINSVDEEDIRHWIWVAMCDRPKLWTGQQEYWDEMFKNYRTTNPWYNALMAARIIDVMHKMQNEGELLFYANGIRLLNDPNAKFWRNKPTSFLGRLHDWVVGC